MTRAGPGRIVALGRPWRLGSPRGSLAAILAFLLVSAALVLASPLLPSAGAQTQLTVDSTQDEPDATVGDGQCVSTPSGRCTLRAAVQEIDPGGTVTVPAGTYVLTIPAGPEGTAGNPPDPARGDLDFSKDVTIAGAGPDRTIVDGNNAARILDVHGGGGRRTSAR